MLANTVSAERAWEPGDAPQLVLPRHLRMRYEIRQYLGTGATSTVYRAVDLTGGLPVAIKLHHDAMQSPLVLERFMREGEVLRKIRHRNVIQVNDFGIAGGQGYMVTEYLDGGTMRDLIRRRRVGWMEAAGLMADVLDGLEALHCAGVVHRDLKPANIFLSYFGQAKIGDLGLVKDYGATPELTFPGALIGTPRYMAPEQIQGRPAIVASDLYACGAIFHELLTGEPLRLASSARDSSQSRTDIAPDLGRDGYAGVPVEIVRLIARAVAVHPGDRIASAGHMAHQLRNLLWLRRRRV